MPDVLKQTPDRFRRRTLGRYRYVRLRWRIAASLIDCLGGLLFGFARAIHRRAAAVRHRLCGLASVKREPECRRILVIQLDHLGDAVLSTVLFPALRRRFPHAAIEVLAAPWNRQVFEALPEVNRIHLCRVNRFGAGRGIGWIPVTMWWGLTLRRRNFDLGIDIRGEFPHAVLLSLSGARRRVGWGSGGGGFLLTDRPQFVPGRPELESRLALLECVGARPQEGELARPRFPIRPQERRLAASWFDGLKGSARGVRPSEVPGPRLVLHAGAGTEAKRWPAECWRELIGRLVYRLRPTIALVGSDAESPLAQEILGPTPPAGVADGTGLFDVAELAAVLQEADVFVGADSGPAHLAAAVGTPVVVLFSGTNNVDQWRPHGERVRVVRHPVPCSPCHRRYCAIDGHPCMTGISPEGVAKEIEAIVGDLNAPRDRTRSAASQSVRLEEVRG